MNKCPDCAEENISESLFCKHCGRCLLAPDPQAGQRPTVTHTERYETFEGVALYDGPMVKHSSVARLKRRKQTAPSVIGGRLLVLNFLVFVLVIEMALYLAGK